MPTPFKPEPPPPPSASAEAKREWYERERARAFATMNHQAGGGCVPMIGLAIFAIAVGAALGMIGH
jgi:hypothetical protein